MVLLTIPAIFFKFKINTKKIGPTDFPLDAIIYGNDDYDKIEGYVGEEDSTRLFRRIDPVSVTKSIFSLVSSFTTILPLLVSTKKFLVVILFN